MNGRQQMDEEAEKQPDEKHMGDESPPEGKLGFIAHRARALGRSGLRRAGRGRADAPVSIRGTRQGKKRTRKVSQQGLHEREPAMHGHEQERGAWMRRHTRPCARSWRRQTRKGLAAPRGVGAETPDAHNCLAVAGENMPTAVLDRLQSVLSKHGWKDGSQTVLRPPPPQGPSWI